MIGDPFADKTRESHHHQYLYTKYIGSHYAQFYCHHHHQRNHSLGCRVDTRCTAQNRAHISFTIAVERRRPRKGMWRNVKWFNYLTSKSSIYCVVGGRHSMRCRRTNTQTHTHADEKKIGRKYQTKVRFLNEPKEFY